MKVPKLRLPQLVRWHRAVVGMMKLNIDGASRGNPGSARADGIVRDSDGNTKMAFLVALGIDTNNYADNIFLLELPSFLLSCKSSFNEF